MCAPECCTTGDCDGGAVTLSANRSVSLTQVLASGEPAAFLHAVFTKAFTDLLVVAGEEAVEIQPDQITIRLTFEAEGQR